MMHAVRPFKPLNESTGFKCLKERKMNTARRKTTIGPNKFLSERTKEED